MHFKQRLLSILLVALMLGGTILGSNGVIDWKTEETSETETVWTSKKETIYIWYVDAALENYISRAAVAFGEQEGVRVIPVLKDTMVLLEDVNAATMDPEKQTPDAFVINNDVLGKAYLAGLATEIQNPSGLVNEAWYPKTALSAVSCSGKLVAYPFYFDTCVLIYNKDYVNLWLQQQKERVPDTIEVEGDGGTVEVVASDQAEGTIVSELISEDSVGDDGIPKNVGGILYFANSFDAPEGVDGVMIWDVADIFYNYWIVGAYLNVGGASGDDEDNVNVNNDETVECLEVYQALNQFFYIEPEAVDYASVMQDFMDGKLVFTIGTTESVQQLEEAKKDGTFPFEYGIASIPSITKELRSCPLSVTEAVAVNGYSEHKDLANRFAEYLTHTYASELYAKAGKISTSYAANRGTQIQSVFIEQYEDSISLPKMMEIGNLWLQLEALFAKVWNGEEVRPLVQKLEEQISTQIGSEKQS